jgi:hypothetical protein
MQLFQTNRNNMAIKPEVLYTEPTMDNGANAWFVECYH